MQTECRNYKISRAHYTISHTHYTISRAHYTISHIHYTISPVHYTISPVHHTMDTTQAWWAGEPDKCYSSLPLSQSVVYVSTNMKATDRWTNGRDKGHQQTNNVWLHANHDIRCIGHVPPCPLGPGLLVLMSDKNVLINAWRQCTGV